MISYGRDITGRVEAEELAKASEARVRESEERFRSLAERVPGFVTIKDSDHRYLYLNSLAGARIQNGEEAWLGKLPEESGCRKKRWSPTRPPTGRWPATW